MCDTHDHTDRSANHARHVLLLHVIDNVQRCDEHYRLTLATTDQLDAQPGQFIQLRCRRLAPPDASSSGQAPATDGRVPDEDPRWARGPVLLPRPFSLAGLTHTSTGSEIELIYRTVGPGTGWMAGLRTGDRVQALGPLGNCFTLPRQGRRAYVVGGGVGLPPMIWLAKALREVGCDVVAFVGAKRRGLMALTLTEQTSADPTEPDDSAEEFARFGARTVLTTDDGSLGVKGLVSDALAAHHLAHPAPSEDLVVYTCGPEPMMRAVAAWCDVQGLPCQVCMERMMACGIGTCQSCVVAIRSTTRPEGFVYKLCCTEGPVFDARDVMWEMPVPKAAYTPPY